MIISLTTTKKGQVYQGKEQRVTTLLKQNIVKKNASIIKKNGVDGSNEHRASKPKNADEFVTQRSDEKMQVTLKQHKEVTNTHSEFTAATSGDVSATEPLIEGTYVGSSSSLGHMQQVEKNPQVLQPHHLYVRSPKEAEAYVKRREATQKRYLKMKEMREKRMRQQKFEQHINKIKGENDV